MLKWRGGGRESTLERTTSGLRVTQASTLNTRDNNRSGLGAATPCLTTRQLQTKTREFLQRKKENDGVVSIYPAASIEKFLAGVWKQIYSSVELKPISLES